MTTVILWLYSKDEAYNFVNGIVNTDNFKCFKYKAKLLGNTYTDGANRVFRNLIMAVPLKYLSSYWRSLEMSLINCKVQLKHKWRKHCVLASKVTENTNAISNNIVFCHQKHKTMYLCNNCISEKQSTANKMS